MTADNEQLQNVAEDNANITELLMAFLANWKWFVLSVFVCLVAAYFYCSTKVPVYQVNASIYLHEAGNSQNAFNLSDAADPMVAFKNYIDETELEVLKSRNNLLKIVDSLDLSYSYYTKGTLRDYPLYKTNPIVAKMPYGELHELEKPITINIESAGDDTFDIKAETEIENNKVKKEFKGVKLPFDIEMSTGTVTLEENDLSDLIENEKAVGDDSGDEPADINLLINICNPRTAAAELSNNFNIEFAKNSEKIIRVTLLTDVIKRGYDIIEVLLDFYNKDIIEDKNRSAVQTEAFILDRLGSINNELKDVEGRLQAYRQAHNVTNLEAQSQLNLTLRSDYEQQAAATEAEMEIYDEIERLISSSNVFETLPAALGNTTIAKVIEDYNLKVTRYNRALEGSTVDNPLVISMKDELSRDKVRILKNLETAKRDLNNKRESFRQLENRTTGQLASAPTIDKGFQEIFREQQVKVNIYTFLLQRREEIALQKTMATNTARLIDNPIGDPSPVSPKKMIILALAFMLGLAIPAGIIFLRRMLFPVFSDKTELQRITNVPIISEICDTGSGKSEREIVVGENTSSPVAELFRLLRNNISFTRSGADSKVILITSTVSGEGKTFISANLALTYALMGKKVLVIGMDLRRPMLAHSFGFSNVRGVTSFLSGQEKNLDKLICQSKVNTNLYVLPAGPIPPNPNELLMSPEMERLIDTVRSEFDYVIIDSAPIGVISDTFLITRYSDLQLYVTRANYSTRGSLSVLHEAVSLGKLSSPYIVLNGVDVTSNSYSYRNYGYYRHSGKNGRIYGYGYGYDKLNSGNKEKNKTQG